MEATIQAILDSDMSPAVPRNLPNIEKAQRSFEDHVWGKVTGAKNSLPMYKDKPNSYEYGGRADRSKSSSKQWAWLALITSMILGMLYWQRRSQGSSLDSRREKDSMSSLKIDMGSNVKFPKAKVDWDSRRQVVKEAFLVSWNAYEEHGWGYDEFHPLSKSGRNMAQPNGIGWIIVDALDTLMVMNLTKELDHAREWVSRSLDYNKMQDVNTFETTIRMLGGLLSAHYLQETLPGLRTGAGVEVDVFLNKAIDLANRIMGAFDSPSGVPWASFILQDGKGEPSHSDGGASSTAEATTLQLELKYLAFLTGESRYWEKAEKVMQIIDKNGAKDGLLPIFIDANTGTFRGSEIRWGSRGDSYYEYLIKQYLQTQKQETVYLRMWKESLDGAKQHLLTYTKNSLFTVLAERPAGIEGPLHPKMDHLVCFLPGTIALAATGGATLAEARNQPLWGKQEEEDIQLARELVKTCMGMYKVTATGLAPEITHFILDDPPRMYGTEILASNSDLDTEIADGKGWKADFVIKTADAHNLQRPETVESLLYMWRITGDEIYREWGWDMFQSFINHTKIRDGGAFTSVDDVRLVPPPHRDNMESFWLAETLKYFYLLFGSDQFLPLDQIVFNTEAHPFPRIDPRLRKFKTGWERIPKDNKLLTK